MTQEPTPQRKTRAAGELELGQHILTTAIGQQLAVHEVKHVEHYRVANKPWALIVLGEQAETIRVAATTEIDLASDDEIISANRRRARRNSIDGLRRLADLIDTNGIDMPHLSMSSYGVPAEQLATIAAGLGLPVEPPTQYDQRPSVRWRYPAATDRYTVPRVDLVLHGDLAPEPDGVAEFAAAAGGEQEIPAAAQYDGLTTSPQWQAGEREADEDITAGRTTFYADEAALDAALNPVRPAYEPGPRPVDEDVTGEPIPVQVEGYAPTSPGRVVQ